MERKFSLPNIEDLTKQQEKIRALPSEGKYLIVGGPGTGKSVVALFRIKKLQRENKSCVCLAFNKLLITSNKQLAQEDIRSEQWQSWFNNIYKNTLGQKIVPRLSSDKEFKDYDWQEILSSIEKYNKSDMPKMDFGHEFLVIDEGQDMPPQFYKALIELGFKNFFVVADQNQRIRENNSSLKELMRELSVGGSQIYDLIDNYRNTYAIAKLCEHFFTDAGSEKPQLPTQVHNSQKPIVYGYDKQSQFGRVIERIINNAKDKPNQLIGIICPNNHISDEYFNALEDFINKNQLNISLTRHYKSNKDEIKFNQGGIVVINAQACKGLEFDVVFLADVNHLYINQRDIDSTKKLLYVMTSRARDRLILLIEKNQPYSDILALLPNDNEVLERYCV